MKYTVDYFIEKFQAIPEELWLIRQFSNADETKGCVNGLCTINKIGLNEFLELFEPHSYIFSPLSRGQIYHSINVNNGDDPKYQQPSPKQRILAALFDIKKMQYPELSTTTINDLFECMPDSATLSRL